MLSRLLQVGLPAAGETILMRIAFLSYTRAISSLGTVVYAAHVIAERVENISFMPALGFSVAATTLSGQALGAGDIKRARESVFRAIEIALLYALLAAGFFAAFPRLMLGLFTNDPAVVAQGIMPLRTLAVAQPLMAIAFSLAGGLRGAGDTRSVMWITGVGGLLVRVPLAILAATMFGWGLPGVYLSMTLDWLTRLMLLWWRFRPSTWQQRARRAAEVLHGKSGADLPLAGDRVPGRRAPPWLKVAMPRESPPAVSLMAVRARVAAPLPGDSTAPKTYIFCYPRRMHASLHSQRRVLSNSISPWDALAL